MQSTFLCCSSYLQGESRQTYQAFKKYETITIEKKLFTKEGINNQKWINIRFWSQYESIITITDGYSF